MTLIKEFMTLCQFTLPKQTSIALVDGKMVKQQIANPEKTPELCIYKSQDEVLMKDQLSNFDSKYQEIHY